MNYVKSLNEFNDVNEAFEVHYSDGIRGMQKFNDKNKAIKFMKDKIASSKNLQEIAVYNASSGFHSTADTDAVIVWWGEGSYLDNVAKKDSKLAAKKLEESLEVEDMNEGLVSIKGGRIIAHNVLNKLVDMEIIPVKKKTDELLETIAKVITDVKMESVEITEKKKDGTISDDEEEREDELMANVESAIDELIAKIKKEASDIGGSFRAPGIEHRVGQLIKAKLQKSKLI